MKFDHGRDENHHGGDENHHHRDDVTTGVRDPATPVVVYHELRLPGFELHELLRLLPPVDACVGLHPLARCGCGLGTALFYGPPP